MSEFVKDIEGFFNGSMMGMGFFMVLMVAIMILCAKLLNHYANDVLPKRIASNVSRSKCAAAIDGKLRGFKSMHECKTLKNLVFRQGEEEVKVDVMLIGYWGIAAFVGCDEQGELYPVEEEAGEMITYVARKKTKVKNPMRERRLADKAVHEVLAGAKLYIKADTQVVFTNRRATLVAPESINGFTLDKLAKYMRAPRFDNDNGVDIDAVYRIFEEKVAK